MKNVQKKMMDDGCNGLKERYAYMMTIHSTYRNII